MRTMSASSRFGKISLTELTIQLGLLVGIVMGDFNLTVLHTNDVHARVEQTNKYSTNCSESGVVADKCYGGVARRYTAIKDIRGNHSNVLLLDAGDQFQGTVWFTYYNGLEASHFMNRLGYDAMAMGNHDFDNGPSGLLSPFLKNASFPVLSCNINFSSYPEIKALISANTIVNLTDGSVGIIGYTTPDTAILVNPNKITNITFNDILPCVRQSVKELKDQGINKIIALGHSGYPYSQEVAKIPGVDIVIDGHSHTLLYNGDGPSNEKITGPYPTEVAQSDGGVALVFQAFAYGKYLGMAEVTFDDEGRVKNWSGNPILLDKAWKQDPEILKEVEEWRVPLITYTNIKIGESYVVLKGDKQHCRSEECNLGNLLTDAVWYRHLRPPTDTQWSTVRIVLWNGGSIKVSLNKGPLTVGNMMEVFPFRDEMDLAWITGATLEHVLEHSVTAINPEDPPGRFLHFSGLRVVYDLSQPEGSRVAEVSVVCLACDVPDYRPLEPNATYPILTNSYLLGGGDGYAVLRDNILKRELIDAAIVDALVSYVKTRSPIYPGLEGRITFKRHQPESGDGDKPVCVRSTNGAAITNVQLNLMASLVFCLLTDDTLLKII